MRNSSTRARPQPPLNSDGTAHRTNGTKRWLWTLVAPTFVFYAIALSQGADALRGLLGESFADVLGSDRLATYLTYVASRRQFCWSHFRTKPVERAGAGHDGLGQTLLSRDARPPAATLPTVASLSRSPRAGGAPLTRAQLIAKVRPIEKRCFALAERYGNAADGDMSSLAGALFGHHRHFFTFVYEEGVEPTNNIAERALRTAVQWRKIMFGNRSAEGKLAVARLLTVTRHLSATTDRDTGVSDHPDSLLPPSAGGRVSAPEAAYPLNCYT